MRRYETIVILDPDISEEDRNTFLERISDLIPKNNGVLFHQDDWGTKKLAYEIKKKIRGYYIRMDYCGDGPLVEELERSFRIDDRVMKYMTVLLDKEADPDKIKDEIAAATEKEVQEIAEASAESTETENTGEATAETPESSTPEKNEEE